MIALMSADPQFAATRTDALETLLAAPHTVDPLLDLDPSNELLGAYRVLGDQILVARGIDRQADPRAWELVFAGALLSELEASLGGQLSVFETMWDAYYALSAPTAWRGKAAPFAPGSSPFYVLVEIGRAHV